MLGVWFIAYRTESVYKVVLQKSIPTQIRQLILYVSNNEGYVDEFVRELAFAERLSGHFLRDKAFTFGAQTSPVSPNS